MNHYKQILLFSINIFLFSCCHKSNSQNIINAKNEAEKVTTIETDEKINDNNENIQSSSKESLTKNFILIKEINFIPLDENEGIDLKIQISKDENLPDSFIICSTKNRELFNIKEKIFYRSYKDQKYFLNENGLFKKMVFVYKNISDNHYNFTDGLCFVDGKTGKAQFFIVRSIFFNKIDTTGSFICIVDSIEVPIITIYDIKTSNIIKEVSYEPYRGKGMFPQKMDYENGAFIVELGADTVEFSTLKIPINGENNFEVIDSYSLDNKK